MQVASRKIAVGDVRKDERAVLEWLADVQFRYDVSPLLAGITADACGALWAASQETN